MFVFFRDDLANFLLVKLYAIGADPQLFAYFLQGLAC